eukprot:TRINITY_DN5531_c0_g1_i1.p1 TRINITY_DN5531_c0_g1~~TRINITY_DN5531_c0_g1_i1.p1  ORF type:complete len:181 (-),score=23.57 TRINITY_DN5531_c0_g1_i1:350-892(-)
MSLKSCLSVSSSKKRNPSSSSSKSVNTVNISSSSSGETKENTSKSKSATKVSSKSEPQKTLSRSSSRTFGTTLQQQSKLDSKLIERDVRKAEKISSKNVPPKSIPTKPISKQSKLQFRQLAETSLLIIFHFSCRIIVTFFVRFIFHFSEFTSPSCDSSINSSCQIIGATEASCSNFISSI